MIKPLSDEAIGYSVLAVAVKDQWCFRGDTLDENLPSYRAVAREAERYRTEQIVEEIETHRLVEMLPHKRKGLMPVDIQIRNWWQELKEQAGG